jgi:hypothetical protein
MPAKKTSKKKAVKKGIAKLTPAAAKQLRETVKLDSLSQEVGSAVKRALATQDRGRLRGPIIMGIIYDPIRNSFTPYLQSK